MKDFDSLPSIALETVTGGAGLPASTMPPPTPRGPFEVLSSNGLARALYGANGQYIRTIVLHP